jgi:hypothetical protein
LIWCPWELDLIDPAENAKPKEIEEALGYLGVAFTMDMYSHVIEGMQ